MPFPANPDPHAIGLLVLTIIALILFTRENIRLETSSLLVAVGFELFPYKIDGQKFHSIDLFSGFGHEALIAVCALMIAGQALVRTGALEPIGRSLAKLWRISPTLSLLLTLVLGAVLSAFINNTPPTASSDNVQRGEEIKAEVQRLREEVEKTTSIDVNSQLGSNIDTYA